MEKKFSSQVMKVKLFSFSTTIIASFLSGISLAQAGEPSAPSGPPTSAAGSAAGAAGAATSTASTTPAAASSLTSLSSMMSMFGALGGAIGLYSSLTNLFSGQFSFSSLLGAAASAFGIYASLTSAFFTSGAGFSMLSSMHLAFLAGPQGALIMIGIIAAIAIAMALIKKMGKKKDQSLGTGEIPGAAPSNTLTPAAPTSWLGSLSSGSVIMLSSGAALMSMGLNLTSPNYQVVTFPAQAVPNLHASLQAASGQNVPANPAGDVFVLQGSNGKSDRALIITANPNGNGDIAQVVTLDSNGNIIGPGSPTGSYIPFFTASSKGALKANPAAVTALNTQIAALKLANDGRLSTKSRRAALNFAATKSKYVLPSDRSSK